MEFNNILIVRTDRIGEVLLSTVSVDSIKKSFPDTKVSFVTSSYSKPLLENRDDIENLYVFDENKNSSVLERAFVFSKMVRKDKYDAAIVLNPHKVLHLGCLLAGIPVRVGFDRKWGFALNRKIKDLRSEGKKHEVEYTFDILRLLKENMAVSFPHLSWDMSLKGSIASIFKEYSCEMQGEYLTIHPGSSNSRKIWGVSRYADLIDQVGNELNINIVLLGTEKERDLTSSIMDKVDHKVIDLTGKLTLSQLAFVLKQSRVFIGNDTGPMHMAAALDVPVIAIFRNTVPGTNPARWRPYTEKAVVFHEDAENDPYVTAGVTCDYRRRDEVTAQDVFEAVKEILNK